MKTYLARYRNEKAQWRAVEIRPEVFAVHPPPGETFEAVRAFSDDLIREIRRRKEARKAKTK